MTFSGRSGKPLRDQRVRLVAGFAVAACSIGVFYLLTHVLFTGSTASINEAVRSRVAEFGTPSLTSFFLGITRLGSTLYLTVVGVAACALFILLGWMRELGIFLAGMVGQIALHLGSKAVFRTARPQPLFDYPDVGGFSYPSGHALASFVVYMVLAGLIAPAHFKSTAAKVMLLLFAAVLVLLIGASRVYLGMHYLSDVLAGFLAAAAWTAAVLWRNNGPARRAVIPETPQ